MAFRSSSTPSTAIPTMRKGSRISQTSGYSTSASNASGQQNTSRTHHKRNVIMTPDYTPAGEDKFRVSQFSGDVKDPDFIRYTTIRRWELRGLDPYDRSGCCRPAARCNFTRASDAGRL